MRTTFAEYYRPDFKNLWQDATFSFDASALLDLYRFSVTSRDELLKLMSEFQDRIWIPHQAAQEFHENRITVIEDVHKTSDIILKLISGALENLDKESKQHPYISTDLVAKISPRLKEVLTELNEVKERHPDLLTDDTLGERIADLLEGRVGQPYPAEKFSALCTEIDSRNDAKVPPGYMDVKAKGKERARGDGLVWFQLMDYAQANQRAIIFVTRDSKEDWWLIRHGRILQPRPELRREFRAKTSRDFYAYTILNFIETAREHLGGSVSAALIAEAQEIATRSENATGSQTGTKSSTSGDEGLITRPVRLRRRTPYQVALQRAMTERHLLLARRRRMREELEAVRAEISSLTSQNEGELSPLQRQSLAELQSRLFVFGHRYEQMRQSLREQEARLLELGIEVRPENNSGFETIETEPGS